MTKHRITLVRDDGVAGYPGYTNEEWINERRDGRVHGFSIERTEKLPDPPIVKKFEVEVTFPPGNSPVAGANYADTVKRAVVRYLDDDRTVTVKEIS